MVICDNCNVCVTKTTFCSSKCRVAYHRRYDSVTNEAKQEKPLISKLVTPALHTDTHEEELPHRCEAKPSCRSFDTTLVTGIEEYDNESNLKEYNAWLCDYHKKLLKR